MSDEPTTTSTDSVITKIEERAPRLVTPAVAARPSDPDKHTRLVRDTPKRIAKFKQQGYVMAKAKDLDDSHQCWKDGEVMRKDDTVVMIGSREFVENKELNRRRTTEEMGRSHIEKLERDASIETEASHGQRRGSKFYSMP
jgi:hypothetical protein